MSRLYPATSAAKMAVSPRSMRSLGKHSSVNASDIQVTYAAQVVRG
jgi:hypothetical protein